MLAFCPKIITNKKTKKDKKICNVLNKPRHSGIGGGGIQRGETKRHQLEVMKRLTKCDWRSPLRQGRSDNLGQNEPETGKKALGLKWK